MSNERYTVATLFNRVVALEKAAANAESRSAAMVQQCEALTKRLASLEGRMLSMIRKPDKTAA